MVPGTRRADTAHPSGGAWFAGGEETPMPAVTPPLVLHLVAEPQPSTASRAARRDPAPS